jgi:predicted porin
VRYVSPNFNGFQLVGEILPAGGATYGKNGLNLNSDSIAEGWDVAGIYSNGPFYASLAYDSLGYELFNDQDISVYESNCDYVSPAATGFDSYCNYNSEDSTAWRVGLGILDWNGFYLTGIYESRDNEPGSGVFAAFTDPTNPANSWYIPAAPHDAELWQIQGGYAFGNNMIKAMYGEANYDSDVYLGANFVQEQGGALFAQNVTDLTDYDVNTWAIGFDHSFSKRTKLYALYTEVDSDQEDVVAGSDWSGFSFGMIHKF